MNFSEGFYGNIKNDPFDKALIYADSEKLFSHRIRVEDGDKSE